MIYIGLNRIRINSLEIRKGIQQGLALIWSFGQAFIHSMLMIWSQNGGLMNT